jgi:hypothetical protein
MQNKSSAGGGRKRGGNPPQCQIRFAPAWAAATTGGVRRLCTLHRERGHCVVAGSVVSGAGLATGARC